MTKVFTVDKEFILQAHIEACSEWKRIIKDKFPDAFEPQLEVGQWYKKEWNDGDIDLFLVISIDNDSKFNDKGNYYRNGVLVDWDNEYQDINRLYSDSKFNFTKAKDKEVEKVLIEEAKRRGLVEGVRYITPQGGSTEIAKGKLKMSSGLDHLYYDDSCYMIFYNGKWAKPIENEIQKRIEELQRQLDELKQKL